MFKMMKYLSRRSAAAIVAILALLVLQASADLALPDYTSRIVNVGIQQSGVENAAPEVLRAGTFDELLLFLTPAEQSLARGSYSLLDAATLSQADYERYCKQYPALEQEPLRLLRTDVTPAMQQSFARAILARQTAQEDPAALGMEQQEPLAQLLNMTEQQRADVVEQAGKMAKALPESMLSQKTVPYVRQEYEAVGVDMDRKQLYYIIETGLRMLAVALVSMAATIVVSYLASQVGAGLGQELRSRVFDKVVSFGNAEMDRFSTASLITRSTNDIQQIQMLTIMLLRMVLYAPIVGIGGIIKVLGTNTSMSWIIAVAVMVIFGLVMILFGLANPRFKLLQKLVDRLNLITREILTGLPVIRAFSAQKHEETRFDEANRALTRTNLFVNRVMSCMMPTMMLVMNLVGVTVIWFGAQGVDTGAMQVGDMMAFLQYTMQIIMAFLMLSMVSVMLPRAAVSAARIDEVLQTEPEIKDPVSPVSMRESRRGEVEFRDVSFRYPGAQEEVLSHISFTAHPGQTTALIGSTGSGKSTLINLVPRFYDVTEGAVLVDGVDVRQVQQQELRARIGYVPQKGVLFSGTIESNILYGRNRCSEEEMERAAGVAQALEFINEKPERFEEPIAQGGANVSGGQKQRLSIARAVAGKPEIYIFDDSFSALDYKTDTALRRALADYTGESTVLIVAQRISTILHADQIVVLDEGRIVGIGTHAELLEHCEIYRQIAQSQLSKEELDHE